MIQLRKSYHIKIISIVLIFLFLFQADMILSQGENLEAQFGNAKEDYVKGNYERASFTLKKLADSYERIDKNEEAALIYGRAILLLGACLEKMQRAEKADENYRLAQKILGENLSIPGLKLEDLKIFKKIAEEKKVVKVATVETKKEKKVIEKPVEKKKKKKKHAWLLIAGGVIVVGLIIFFIKKNKDKYGELTIMSSPSIANIWIDGSLQNKSTPATFENIEAKQHKIKVGKAGYKTQERNVKISGGKERQENFSLTDIKYGRKLTVDGSSAVGYILGTWDPDWYWFYIKNPGNYTIETSSWGSNEVYDNLMYLYGIDNRTNEIEHDDDDGTVKYALISRYLQPGNYFVKITGFNSGYSGSYRIKIFSGSVSALSDEKKDKL